MQVDSRRAKRVVRSLLRDRFYRSSVANHTIVVNGREQQVTMYGMLEELKRILHKVPDEQKYYLKFWCNSAIQEYLNNATLEELLGLIPETCDMSHGEFIAYAQRNIRDCTDTSAKETRRQLTVRMRQVREYLQDQLELVKGLIHGFHQDFNAFARLDELKMLFRLLRVDNIHSALLMRAPSSTTLSIFVESVYVTYDAISNSFVNYPESRTHLPISQIPPSYR